MIPQVVVEMHHYPAITLSTTTPYPIIQLVHQYPADVVLQYIAWCRPTFWMKLPGLSPCGRFIWRRHNAGDPTGHVYPVLRPRRITCIVPIGRLRYLLRIKRLRDERRDHHELTGLVNWLNFA